MNWYLEVLKKYAVFDGRARRKEYWYFVFYNYLFSIALGFLDATLGTINLEMGYGLISMIYSFAILIPSIAVAVRRMHDVGKSGWFILIPIYNLILCLTEGDKGANQYGEDPKKQELDITDHLV